VDRRTVKGNLLVFRLQWLASNDAKWESLVTFAVVQHELVGAPSAEALARAFAAVAQLTRADAKPLARDAFGIVTAGMSFADASAVQQVLAVEGFQTEVVDQTDLPALPAPKQLRRAECLETALVVYDALGRPARIAWDKILLIAAGSVGVREFVRTGYETPVTETSYLMLSRLPHHAERHTSRLMAEIVLDAEPARYRIGADRFQYAYLGGRLRPRGADNFVLLVRDLTRLATRASANRGAVAMEQDPPQTFAYPTRHAFEEEMVWLLWQSRRPPAAPQ